jgi:hypothetical protein
MREQRREARHPRRGEGFFQADDKLVEIKVRDYGEWGLGLFSAHEFRTGQQGLLLLKAPEAGGVKKMAGEVCWCNLDPEAQDGRYPFRAGLRVITA